jgi:hypothetical protein
VSVGVRHAPIFGDGYLQDDCCHVSFPPLLIYREKGKSVQFYLPYNQ